MAHPQNERPEKDYREVLRRLSLSDERCIAEILTGRLEDVGPVALDPRTRRLVAVAALIGIEAGEAAISAAVEKALAAGAQVEEVVEVLLSVAPSVGSARIVAVAPRIAASIGYDLSEAYEEPPVRTG